mmetsp:Transcript_1638/g.5157  ORF Transcript_1638/g.5157 Transcript_1638/m.5157 type:complete len:253 (+) Transcript_1638:86-844(+)
MPYPALKGRVACSAVRSSGGGGGRDLSRADVVRLELAREEEAALVEERQRYDGLEDADALAAEDAAEAKLGHVGTELAHSLEGADGLALDRVGLHDDLEAGERVGDDHVDGRDDGRRDEVGRGAGQLSRLADLLLHVLLQLGLADEAEHRRRERVAHQRDRPPEEGREILRGRLAEDLHDRLLGARLLEEGTLLLLHHADRVDEGGGEDGGGGGSGVARLVVPAQVRVPQQHAELRDPLEEDSDQARPQPRH